MTCPTALSPDRRPDPDWWLPAVELRDGVLTFRWVSTGGNRTIAFEVCGGDVRMVEHDYSRGEIA